MPCVSGRYQKSLGVIVGVVIIKPLASTALTQSSKQHPAVPLRQYRALLDTGATGTCISSKVVAEVGLESIGLGEIISASEKTHRNKYFFSLGIPIIEKVDPNNNEVTGKIHQFPPIEGPEFHTEQNARFDVLLGMDIIANGCFTVEQDGHFSFWF